MGCDENSVVNGEDILLLAVLRLFLFSWLGGWVGRIRPNWSNILLRSNEIPTQISSDVIRNSHPDVITSPAI